MEMTIDQESEAMETYTDRTNQAESILGRSYNREVSFCREKIERHKIEGRDKDPSAPKVKGKTWKSIHLFSR